MSATRTRICGNHFHAVSAMPGASVICPACGLVFGEAPSGQFESATIQAEKPPPRTLLANPEAEVPKRRSGAVKADAMADVSIAKKRRRWPLFLSLLGVIIIIVLNMAGGLADVVFPEIMMIGGGTTRKEIAPVQVKSLSVTRDLYRFRNGKFPADLKVLVERDQFRKRAVEDPDSLLDPWGQPYQYDPNGPKNGGRHADIWTTAPDGTEIGNWPRGQIR